MLGHVFQVRAPSGNPTKINRADELCVNLHWFGNIFWGCSVTPTFFGRLLPFLILSIILKNKKNLSTIQIGSNWYMDTGVCDLNIAFFNANYT